MQKSDGQLSEKEKLFCQYYANARNVREAAAMAGYGILAEVRGMRLLCRDEIKNEIERIRRSNALSGAVKAGLERIAFGSVSDAVKLLMNENQNTAEIDKLDLFCISEIKRPREGAMEIKFFDRIKALERLMDISENSGDNFAQLFGALEKSAEILTREER